MKVSIKNITCVVAAATFATATLSSCGENSTGWEFAPNMYNSRAYEPQTQWRENTINPHGMNMRQPVAGTVARQTHSTRLSGDSSKVMVYDIAAGDIATSAATLKNPIAWSEKVEAEGKVLYERNCQHCHGETGAGDGKVAKMYKGVPVYSSDAVKNLSEGHIFHVITHGIRRMWPHASQVTPEERWKIVHYVQRLQKGG